MNIPHHVRCQYDLFTNWLLHRAFPYWGTVGGDGLDKPFQWGSHEQLKMDGSPDFPGYKRLRVQARQLYSFTQGALLGWTPGNYITEKIYQFMQNAILGEGQWAKSLTREGQILDPSSDLYDIAFIIFSLSWYARLSNDPRPVQQARQTLQWIEKFMAYPQEGYKNIVPLVTGYRQQNPHMHLLEAILVLYETTGAEEDLVIAHKLVHLFKTRFFNHQAGVLEEYFVENWARVPHPMPTEVEPGHQYEWIWLLSEYERLTGIRHKDEMQRMYHFNERYAIDQATGLVADKVQTDGTLVNKSARLWVQTEAIRATSLMHNEKSYQHLGKIIDNLLRRYFKNCPNGTWQDQLTHCYTYNSTKIPTSSFYHIVSGYMQLHHTIQLSTLSTTFPTINTRQQP